MNHFAAFILRLAASAAIDVRVPWNSKVYPFMAADALMWGADRYDSVIPMPLPLWMASINSTGGEA